MFFVTFIFETLETLVVFVFPDKGRKLLYNITYIVHYIGRPPLKNMHTHFFTLSLLVKKFNIHRGPPHKIY